jgi:hypothetical protein
LRCDSYDRGCHDVDGYNDDVDVDDNDPCILSHYNLIFVGEGKTLGE